MTLWNGNLTTPITEFPCYSEAEITGALAEAGFTEIEVYDISRDFGFQGQEWDGRYVFVCGKAKA